MTDINLAEAKRLADFALDHAASLGALAISVVVLDRAGATRLVYRTDQGSLVGPEIALAKARSGMAFRLPTLALNKSFADNPSVTSAVAAATAGKFLPLGGGLPLFDAAGDLIGAIGVAGSTQENDHAIAAFAADAAGVAIARPVV